MSSAISRLTELLHTVADIRAAKAVLEWDQETYMPSGAAEGRACQIATLERVAHERFTSDEAGALLEAAEQESVGLDPDSNAACLVRSTRRDFNRLVKLPLRLVTDLAETSALALEAWRGARSANAFTRFRPHLERLLDLNREKTEALGFEEEAYDALLDEYEPDMRASTLDRIFHEVQARLVPIVEAIAAQPPVDDSVLRRRYDTQKQWDFGLRVIGDFGYDFDRGRQDRSTHPFTTSFAISDVRITTRFDEHYLPSALFGTMHEAGHALYEQGIDPGLARTPLADGASLGIHESQSRLWENLVGRSLPFWRHYYPDLKQTFPESLSRVDLAAFYRAINRVQPTFIRVEADEVTYNLHILVRFNLERALLSGRLSVADLPEAWNETIRRLLGIVPPSDAQGCLQDIHWAMGAIGYFPTYTLGNLISVALFDQARVEIRNLDEQISMGRFADLLAWLRENIHRHGRKFSAERLVEQVTGHELTAEPWLRYIDGKYGELYGCSLGV